MKTKRASMLPLAGLVLVLLAGELAVAGDAPSKESRKPTGGGLPSLIGAVAGLPVPDLAGLIAPEKVGLLTDNEAVVNLLSGNQVKILSDMSLLSGFTINVHVTMEGRDSKASRAKKSETRRGEKKAKRRKSKRKSRKLRST